MTGRATRYRRLVLGLMAGVGACLIPSVALSSPLFEVFGGATGMAGSNGRVTGPSSASTYFNPALLPRAPRSVTGGYYFVAEAIGVQLGDRNGPGALESCAGSCDVPVVNGAGPESFLRDGTDPLQMPTIPTAWLQEGRVNSDGELVLPPRPRQGRSSGSRRHHYAVVGLVQPLAREHLVLGFHQMLPLSDFIGAAAFYNDEREQFFSNSLHPELYGDRLRSTSLALGLGSQVTERFALGLSFTLRLRNQVTAPVYVFNLADLDTVYLDSDIRVQASVAPHVGATWEPVDGVVLSATLHTPQSLETEAAFAYLISSGSEQEARVRFTHAYLPWTFGGGVEVGFALLGMRWAAAAGLKYALWSDYRDRHGQQPLSPFDDTLEGVVGLRQEHGNTRSYIDLVYAPSPVPAQVGRRNYVDNDRAGFNAGADYRIALDGAALRVGLRGQLHRLFARSVTKDPSRIVDEVPDDARAGIPPGPVGEGLQTNNPGFPSFGSEGWVLGLGTTLTLEH